MIVTKLQGGLGNQMFQYAFGRKLQEQFHQKLILDISDFQYDKMRDYSLGHYLLTDQVIIDDSGKYNKFYDQRVNYWIKLGNKLCPNLLYETKRKKGIYIWDYVKYKDIIVKQKKDILLHGLWQGECYFRDMHQILSKEFIIKDEIFEINRELLSDITNSNSVCVHIRRGDFLLSSNKLCNCTDRYYLNAVKLIKEKVQSPIFFVFSDEINHVKKQCPFEYDKNVVFVEQNNPDYEELRLMYSCKHFIIANSTFSWWAAYLSGEDGIVIAPANWYSDNRDVSHLLRKSWIVLNN